MNTYVGTDDNIYETRLFYFFESIDILNQKHCSTSIFCRHICNVVDGTNDNVYETCLAFKICEINFCIHGYFEPKIAKSFFEKTHLKYWCEQMWVQMLTFTKLI